MYLSYSGFKKYDDCQFAYWNSYVGKTSLEGPDDRLGSVYGTIVGKLFEDFYKLKVWRQEYPKTFLLDRVKGAVEEVLAHETQKGGVLLWKGEGPDQNPKGMYDSREQLVSDVSDAVDRGLQIIRHHRLVGPRADAEFKLDLKLKGATYAGRADFLIQRISPHSDLVIVDGKGSRHRDKYVDPRQLKWYAMLFWLQALRAGTQPKIPDKLGFLFWRESPEAAIDWIEVSEAELGDLFSQVKEALADIETKKKSLLPGAPYDAVRGVFKPRANEKNCRFCPFAHVCPPGRKIQEILREKEKSKK